MKPVVEHHGHTVEVLLDIDPKVTPSFSCTVIHDEKDIREYVGQCEGFLAAIVSDSGRERVRCSRILEGHGLVPISAIHPRAYLADSVRHGKGLQAMAGATVTEDARLGDHVILNTNCTVDHDCVIGDAVHVMGVAYLASSVIVGDFATIGANATVLPRVRIGPGAYVGAGAVVTKDVEENTVVVGVPARLLRDRE